MRVADTSQQAFDDALVGWAPVSRDYGEPSTAARKARLPEPLSVAAREGLVHPVSGIHLTELGDHVLGHHPRPGERRGSSANGSRLRPNCTYMRALTHSRTGSRG